MRNAINNETSNQTYPVSDELFLFFPESVHDLDHLRAEPLHFKVSKLILVSTSLLSVSLCYQRSEYLSSICDFADDKFYYAHNPRPNVASGLGTLLKAGKKFVI